MPRPPRQEGDQRVHRRSLRGQDQGKGDEDAEDARDQDTPQADPEDQCKAGRREAIGQYRHPDRKAGLEVIDGLQPLRRLGCGDVSDARLPGDAMHLGRLIEAHRSDIACHDPSSAALRVIDEHRIGQHVDLQIRPAIGPGNRLQCVVDLIHRIAGRELGTPQRRDQLFYVIGLLHRVILCRIATARCGSIPLLMPESDARMR